MSHEAFNNSRVRRLAAAASCVGLFALAGCGYDGEGEKNHFKVRGTVQSVGKHSVTVKVTKMLTEEGESVGWFENGKVRQIHDNNRKIGFLSNCDLNEVGKEYDVSGAPQDLTGVKPGEHVELDGRIRDSSTDCIVTKNDDYDWEQRPVYDTLRELPS